MNSVTDRRAYSRQPTVPNMADLTWGTMTTDGGREARILNISRGGASLESRHVPPDAGTLWMRLATPIATPWVAATVVRRDGPCGYGLRFRGDCPDDLMLAVTLGIALRF